MSARAILVGPPGAGKTTVGRLLAAELGATFLDTDELAASVAGKTVADIFLEDGEDRFRELERAAVRSVLGEQESPGIADGAVVALGGGAILNPDTREELAGKPVVALTVDLTDAVKRVGLARDRPLLVEAPRARMSATLRERAPLYAQVAALRVDTSGRSPDDIVKEVLAWLTP